MSERWLLDLAIDNPKHEDEPKKSEGDPNSNYKDNTKDNSVAAAAATGQPTASQPAPRATNPQLSPVPTGGQLHLLMSRDKGIFIQNLCILVDCCFYCVFVTN